MKACIPNICLRLGAVAFGLVAATASAAVEYQVVDLGTLGGTRSTAQGINDRGQVVGWSKDEAGRTQAFLWQNGTMAGLGFLPGGTSSVANAINNDGAVTGYSYVSPTNYHAFLYISNNLTDIGTLGGPNSQGRGINSRGDIVGSSWLATNSPNNSDPETFIWRHNQFIHIPPFGGNDRSCDGYGINHEGRISGISFLYSPNPRWWGYVWHDSNGNGSNEWSEMKLLGSLAPKDSGGEYSGANDLNDIGQVVGWTGITSVKPDPVHAFLITASNEQWKIPDSSINPANALMQDLGALESPTNSSSAKAINNQTWIVGSSSTSSGTNQAFLWRNGVMTNLNQLIVPSSGWVLTNATGINEHNEIVGSGLYQGQQRAFLLRQEGRVTHVDPVVQTSFWIYTNALDEVVTQIVEQVEAQVLHWSGIWGTNTDMPRVFTVESCDALPASNWAPCVPTAQWPIVENYWTNADFGAVSTRFFRVRAH
jgi:probable HAF family extracellular repeat protein